MSAFASDKIFRTFATTAALCALAATAQSAVFRTTWDPQFNVAFTTAVGQNVGWRGVAFFTVDNGCLVANSTQTVGVGSCASATLDSATLGFYDTLPATSIGGVAWAGLLPALTTLRVDASGEVDGLTIAAPLTSPNFNPSWTDAYDIALDFTFGLTYSGPILTLTQSTDSSKSFFSSTTPGDPLTPIVTFQQIPEPGALALVGLALAALGLQRRRRR